MHTAFNYILLIIAFSSIALIALSYLEGAIAIWIPRSTGSRFWSVFDRILLTLRYVSASEEKLARARFVIDRVEKLRGSTEVRDASE